MATRASSTSRSRSTQNVGEAYVWLTAMGLTIGLFMIIFLLGLVMKKGLEVFWPKPVAELTVEEGSASMLMGSTHLAGELAKIETSKEPERDPTTEKRIQLQENWQIYVGNKDVYGLSFTYVAKPHIVDITYPTNFFRIERTENGPAFGYPVRVTGAEDASIASDEPGFRDRLHELVSEVNARRQQIKTLEKEQIGHINHQMTQLDRRQAYLEHNRESIQEVESELAEVKEERATLQKEYETLAAQAGNLREQQNEHQLTYQLASGQEHTIPLGKVMRFHFPNELGFVEKSGLFFKNLWLFLSSAPREANTDGGIFPAIFGTFVMTLLMSVAVTPFGVLAAIYLREYAKQGPLVRSVRIAVNNLAGVPSIVFGAFGLGFFVYFVGGTIDRLFYPHALPTPTFGTGGILWASLTLALLTVPVVIVSTEEALASVSRGSREGSLACGASKWQTIQRIVLPASAPGILTGVILAMARGAGEVAPLMLVGVVKLAPELPINDTYPFVHLDQKFMHLGFHIYDLGFQSPDSEAARPMVFATTLVLITLVIVLNLAAIVIRERLRRRYATSKF